MILRQLSQLEDVCQLDNTLISKLQMRLLRLIVRQSGLHDRTVTFMLGSTERTHTFGPNETFMNTAVFANILNVSRSTIRRVVAKLECLNLVSVIHYSSWSSVRHSIYDDTTSQKDDALTKKQDDALKSVINVNSDALWCTGPDLRFISLDINKEESKDRGPVRHMFDNRKLKDESEGKRRRSLTVMTATELRKNPTAKGKRVDALIRLNNLIADLPVGVMGSKPRRDRIARKVFARWSDIHGRGECSVLRDYVTEPEDQDAIIEALKAARMVHGSKWLTFLWVLSFPMQKNSFREQTSNEPNLAKLLDGKYNDVPDWLEQKRQATRKTKTIDDAIREGGVDPIQAAIDKVKNGN